MSELSNRMSGKPNSRAESRSGVIRSEDDDADTVVKVEESVRSHKLLSELISIRVSPV